jgi:DNA end-binding protein Ku
MAPRSIWNGTITFGMVNVPIKLYSATESKSIHFHEVHVKDGARIEHRRICPKDEREVPQKEIVKGYEVAPDAYVVLEKDEVKAAAGDRGKVVHIEEFVAAGEIDPIFFEKTYYVGSRDDEDSYRLLHEALRRTGHSGIGRFSFHDREYLVALRALDDVLALHTLRFHDEVASAKDLMSDGRGRKPSQQEVRMANQLVESLGRDFDPKGYEDTYREAVLDLIKRKSKGEEIDLLEQEEPEQGDDLAAALEASLRSSKDRSGNGRRPKRKSGRRASGSRTRKKAKARS